ncbi:ester cyclase [Halogranum amylolyticum]|nr:ester cyclase [Halogranum amylolyticum]
MTDDRRRWMEISRQDFVRVWGDRELEAITDIYSPTYRGHGFPLKGTITRAEYWLLVSAFQQVCPDCEVEMVTLTADDSFVYTDWVFRGTHTGSVAGVPPSGARLEFEGSGRHRHENGRVAEAWLSVDWREVFEDVVNGYAASLDLSF